MNRLLMLCICILFFSCTGKHLESEWSLLKTIDGSTPKERHEAAFVKVEDKFYLLGGRGIRPVSIYDTKTNMWTEGAAPPIEIHHFQPVVYNKNIYIIGAFTGGWPNETPIERIIMYMPLKNSWVYSDEIPSNRLRGAAGAALSNDKIYISCGLQNGHIGDHTNWLDSYDLKTKEWTILKDAPRTRDHFNAVIIEDQMYLTAGRNTTTGDNPFGNTIKEVDVYDINTNSWRTLKDGLPTLRAGNAAIAYNKEVLVIGGESNTQEIAHNDVEALNISSETWRKLPSLEQGRHGTGVIEFKGDLYIASGCGKRGGEPELNTIEKYSRPEK